MAQKKRRKPKKRVRKKPGQGRLRRFLVISLAVFVLVSIALTLPWRWLPPPTTSFMLQHRFGQDAPVFYRWVDMEKISPALAIAVVAAEDQRFPQHHGFDLKEISKALNEDRGQTRGASTITQQLAKNLYLWPGRSLFRKGLEAYFTVLLELMWTKQRILEVYLNVVEFGPGLYGAEAAAQIYFNTTARKLNSRQAALLAALLPNPKKLSPHRPSAYVRERAAFISKQVKALGGAGYLLWL